MPQQISKDEMGKLLLSLLVARRELCTINELEKDYISNEGQKIPYMDFGNLSLLDFLRSIPKYVNVFCQHGGYYVRPVVTEKTKHVSDLVSRQKTGKRGNPSRRRTSRSRYFPQVREPKPFIPNILQNKVAEILTANPSGVDKDKIISCLQGSSAMATPIDSSNIDDYVRSMPFVAHASNNLIYPHKSLHLANMSEQQDLPNTSTNAIPPLMGSTYVSTNAQAAAAAYPAGYEDEDDIFYQDNFDEIPMDLENKYSASNNLSQQYVIDDHKTKISSAEFIMRAGQQHNHSQINTIQNNNTKNYCDDTEFEGHSDADNESAHHDSDPTHISDDEYPRYIINPRLKARLQQLIQKHPEGIWCADLLQKYLEEYRVELDYTDLGFSSVSELASTSNLKDIFHCVRYKRLGDFKLYDATKPLPERLVGLETDANSSDWEEKIDDDIEADPFSMFLATDIPSRLIPNEVLNHGESVGQEKIPDLLDATNYLEVIAAEVFSPSLFWIHLRKKKPKLDQLMESLNNFYKHEGDRYTIPHVILEKGLNCACQYDNLWHRATIKTVKPNGDVTLIFYDYGTVKTFPPESVRFLHRDFSNLPAQAIPCGLYNIKPLNADAWTRGVSSEFWDRIYEIPLIAIIAKIDKQTNSMLISLVDTQEEEDLHINDWMVQMKFAEFGSMGDGVAFESSYLEDRTEQTQAAPVIPDNTTAVNSRNTDDHEDATAVSEDIPLVSPQSTLKEGSQTTLRPPPGFKTPPTQNYYASFMDACSTQRADGSIGMASSSFMNFSNFHVNNNLSTSVDECQLLNPTRDIMLQFWKQRLELDMQMVAAAERYILLDRNSHTPNTVSNDPSTISRSTTTSPNFDTASKNPFYQDSGKQEPESVSESKHSNSENHSYLATTDSGTLKLSEMAKFLESNEPEFGFFKPSVTQQNCQDISSNPLETNFTDNSVTNRNNYKNEGSISMQELNGQNDYSTLNNGNNIFLVPQKYATTKKPFEFNSDRKDINANHTIVVNNEQSAENQFLETNPFKQYLDTSIPNTKNNDKPPIPPRNPNLINENLNINVNIKKLEALPVITNQHGNSTPRIYYTADPVMYKLEARETSGKSSELERETPGSNDLISIQGKRQHDTLITPHLTNYPSNNNSVFVFGRNHSPRQNTFSPNVNSSIGSVQDGDTLTPSTKHSTDSTQGTTKIFPNTPGPISQSYVTNNSTEFQCKSEPISPRFTAPFRSELSQAAIDAVRSASEMTFYDDLEFATLKTRTLSTRDAESPNLSTNNEQSSSAMVENNDMFVTTSKSTPHFQSPMPLHNPFKMNPRPQTFQHVQQSNTNVKQGSLNQRTMVSQMEEKSRLDEKNNLNGIQSAENASEWVTKHQKIFETETDRHATGPINENHDFWKKLNDCGPMPNTFTQEPLLDEPHTLKQIDDNSRISSHNGTMMNNYSQGYFNNINHNRNMAHNNRSPPYQSQLHNIAQQHPPIYPQSNFQCMSTNPKYIQHLHSNQIMPFPRPYSPIYYFPQPPSNYQSFPLSKPRSIYPYPNISYPFPQNQPPWCVSNSQIFAFNQTTNTRSSIPDIKPSPQIRCNNSNLLFGQMPETSDLMKDHRIPRSSFGQVDTAELQTASITDNKIAIQNENKSYTGGSSRPTQQLENKYTLPSTPIHNIEESTDRDIKNLLKKPFTGTPNIFKPIDVNAETMYLFNIAKEGWVCTDELVKLFTIHDNRQVVLRILNQLDLKINFKEITRAQSPDLFCQLDSTSLRVPRMANSNKIKGTLHLTPLKSVIRLMRILEVISAAELSLLSQKRRIAPGSRLLELVRLVAAYKPDDDSWMS